MTTSRGARLMLLHAALTLSACDVSSSRAEGPVTGANERFTFELLNPSPLTEGYKTLTVNVHDTHSKLPIQDAEVSLQLLMPSMGHESRPEASEIDAGRYEVPNALLDMPGAWVLRVRVEDDGATDEAELYFEVL